MLDPQFHTTPSNKWNRPTTLIGANRSPRAVSGASELIGYGSYSGADIKVVVHLPYNPAGKDDALAAIQREIDEVSEYYSRAEGSRTREEHRRALVVLEREKEKIEDRGFGTTTETLGNLQTLSYSVFREKTPIRTLGSVYPTTFVRGPRTIGGSMIFTIFNEHVLSNILDKSLRYYNTGNLDKDIYVDSTMMVDQLPPLDISIIFANEYGSVSHMGLWGVQFLQEGGTFSIEDIFSESPMQYVAQDIDPMRTVGQRELDDSGVINKWRAQTASQLANDQGHLLRRNPWM